MVPDTDDQLTATFAALANATRRQILDRLAVGSATVNEIAEPFDVSLPAISKHLKVLQEAGLVVRGRNAQFRPCTLDAAPLADVASWADQYRTLWGDSLNRLDAYLDHHQPTPAEGTPHV